MSRLARARLAQGRLERELSSHEVGSSQRSRPFAGCLAQGDLAHRGELARSILATHLRARLDDRRIRGMVLVSTAARTRLLEPDVSCGVRILDIFTQCRHVTL